MQNKLLLFITQLIFVLAFTIPGLSTQGQAYDQKEEPIKSLDKMLAAIADNNQLIKKAKDSMRTQPVKALEKAKLALQRAIELKDTLQQLEAYDIVTSIQVSIGQLKSSTIYATNFIKLAGATGIKKQIGLAFHRQGTLLYYMGLNEQAITYLLKALKIKEQLGDTIDLVRTYNNLGIIYQQLWQYEEALKYYNLSLAYLKDKKDESLLSAIYNNLGTLYLRQKKYTLCEMFTNNALAIKQKLNDKVGIYYAYNNLGLLAFEQKDYHKALKYLERIIESEKEFGTNENSVGSKIFAGEIYLIQQNYQKSEKLLLEALRNTRGNNMVHNEKDANYVLSLLYAAKKDLNKMELHSQAYLDANDSINVKDIALKVANIKVIYDSEKQLNELELKDKSLAIKDAELKHKNLWIIILVMGSIMLVMLVLITLMSYRQKAISNRLLAEQKEEILTQNHELDRHRGHLERLVEKRTADLENAKIAAEKSDRLKTIFLTNLSHEIRTPMNAINGFSDLLNRPDYSDAEKNDFVAIVKQNANSLLSTIDNLVDISKIKTGQLELHFEEFLLSPLLLEIKQYAHDTFFDQEKEHNIVFDFQVLENIPMRIKSDRSRLRQILVNLIDNAFKYTEVGFVRLQVREEPAGFQFTIIDSGIGIEKDIAGNIFEMFTKSTEDSAYSHRGIGLGLPISKELTSLLGGKIWFESYPGIGTSFYVWMPKGI
jgi:signal transduction histidine kinase